MRLEQSQSRQPRLPGKAVHGKASATTGVKPKKKATKPKGSRFVGPAQLDEKQKSQIREALKKKKIGDEMDREIFIGAMEYQISVFSQRLAPSVTPESEPKPESPGLDGSLEKALRAIIANTSSLSDLLRTLPNTAKARVTEILAGQDVLGRGYDERYLCELGCEIDRLERACSAIATAVCVAEPETELPGEASEPKPDPAVSRELVAKLAGIFSECFEMEPTAEDRGPFRASLKILGEATGMAIEQEPEFLAQVLAGQGGEAERG